MITTKTDQTHLFSCLLHNRFTVCASKLQATVLFYWRINVATCHTDCQFQESMSQLNSVKLF